MSGGFVLPIGYETPQADLLQDFSGTSLCNFKHHETQEGGFVLLSIVFGYKTTLCSSADL